MIIKLKVRCLDLDAGGKTIAVINSEDAREMGIHALERIILKSKKQKLTVIANVSSKFVLPGDIAIFDEVRSIMRLRDGDIVEAEPRQELVTKRYIKKKIEGEELNFHEIKEIVQDILARNLSDLEQASLITALSIRGLTLEENINFARAMIETSKEVLKFSGTVVDKHSAGGIPGDKTTMLFVPIIAATGLTIPKTSSRAITDPAGTADRVEVLAPVDIPPKKIEEVVKKTGGCMVWGGALNLAPADDLIIQIEKPLSLDPLIIPSVLAKKKVVGSKYIVIDLPTGPEAKMKTKEEAEKLAQDFINTGKRLGLHVECAVTYADQPLGYAIGPALEAREVLQAIMNPKTAPKDLINKVISIAGILLRMVNRGDAQTAERILMSGAAEEKFREIITAQGGNGDVKPSDIPIEKKTKHKSISSSLSGYVSAISNKNLVLIAKLAGAPKDKYAGVMIHKKLHDKVRKGEPIFTIYSENPLKLHQALKFAKDNNPMTIYSDSRDMVIEELDHVKKHNK